MLLAAICPLLIKDLKDLRALLCRRSIDMQVLTDLKRCFLRVCSRGTGPRATMKKRAAYRRARDRPSQNQRLAPRSARACPSRVFRSPREMSEFLKNGFWLDLGMARDRPSPYGEGNDLCEARDRPSPYEKMDMEKARDRPSPYEKTNRVGAV